VAVVVGSVVLAVLSSLEKIATTAALSVIAGLIGTLSLYLVTALTLLERRLDAVERQDVNVGSEIVSQIDWYEHLCLAIKTANTSIDITHHEPRLPTMSGIPAKQEVFRLLYKRIKQRKVLIRMLVAINTTEKLEWIEELLDKYSDCANFDLKHSELGLEESAPALSIQVVDGSKGFVIDMAKSHHTLSEQDTDLYTREPDVAQQLRRYYNSYWQQCTWIKEGGIIHWGSLADVSRELGVEPAARPR
jgi:hypothetical protein